MSWRLSASLVWLLMTVTFRTSANLPSGRACRSDMPLNASPSSTASLLQIAPGADVLTLNRIVETADGDPVEWRVTFRPEYARVRARGIEFFCHV